MKFIMLKKLEKKLQILFQQRLNGYQSIVMLSKDNLEIANSFREHDDNDDVQNIYTNLNVVNNNVYNRN